MTHYTNDGRQDLPSSPVFATWSSDKLYFRIYMSLVDPSFPSNYLQKDLGPYMADHILDVPPLNYGISQKCLHLFAIWLHNLHESLSPVSWNSTSEFSIRKMRWVQSSLKHYRTDRLTFSKSTWKILVSTSATIFWAPRMCSIWKRNAESRNLHLKFGHSQIWKVYQVLVVRSDCKKFTLVGKEQNSWHKRRKQTVLVPYPPHLVACSDSV